MKTTLFMNGRSQAVRVPKELRMSGKEVTIRRFGLGLLIEPMEAETWPEGYFEAIRIEDPAFERPDHGSLPPAPSLEK